MAPRDGTYRWGTGREVRGSHKAPLRRGFLLWRVSMLGMGGLAMTAAGTILAIVHPQIGAVWAGGETEKSENKLRIRYYTGISLIVVGTVAQMLSYL